MINVSVQLSHNKINFSLIANWVYRTNFIEFAESTNTKNKIILVKQNKNMLYDYKNSNQLNQLITVCYKKQSSTYVCKCSRTYEQNNTKISFFFQLNIKKTINDYFGKMRAEFFLLLSLILFCYFLNFIKNKNFNVFTLTCHAQTTAAKAKINSMTAVVFFQQLF